MAERYWHLMTDKKFALIYLGLHYHRNVKIERWLDIILAVISTGSLGALFVLDEYQFVLTVILALAQVATAARPYLPYQYRVKELDKGITLLNALYNEIEKKWFLISDGKLSDDEINELYYKYLKKWDELDSEILKKDSLPRRKNMINIAQEEKNQYFEVMFGGSTDE